MDGPAFRLVCIVLTCMVVIPFAFWIPGAVIYTDTLQHVVTICNVTNNDIEYLHNGCSEQKNCDEDGNCDTVYYDCWEVTYIVTFRYNDSTHVGTILDPDEFDEEQKAMDRANNYRPIGSAHSCVVNPEPDSQFKVAWGDAVDNTAWIVLFVFGSICSLPCACSPCLYCWLGGRMPKRLRSRTTLTTTTRPTTRAATTAATVSDSGSSCTGSSSSGSGTESVTASSSSGGTKSVTASSSDSGTETVTVTSSSGTESVTITDSNSTSPGDDATVAGADADAVPGTGDDAESPGFFAAVAEYARVFVSGNGDASDHTVIQHGSDAAAGSVMATINGDSETASTFSSISTSVAPEPAALTTPSFSSGGGFGGGGGGGFSSGGDGGGSSFGGGFGGGGSFD